MTRRLKSLDDGRSLLLVTETLFLVIPVTYTTSDKRAGNLLVRLFSFYGFDTKLNVHIAGNYDINELWYEYEGKKKVARQAAVGSPMAVEA